MPGKRYEPQLFTVLRGGYRRSDFSHDLVAGILVGIVALPISLAFAIASGVRPEQGLYTAVIAGFLISALSGSRFQIGGPTGAFIVIVYDIVQTHGYEGLAAATLIAGLFLILMGVAGLGSVIKFIPYPVTVGFTSGIALIIFITQVRDFLGLQMESVPPDFLEKCVEYAQHLSTANPHAIAVGALSIAIILMWPRISHRVPGPLVAILATTALVHILGWPVETIGSRFGAVPDRFAPPSFPDIDFAHIGPLLRPALVIALLAGIESLLSAVVADGMTGTQHRSNMELIGQGVANVASPLFGGIPATGAIARTATNIKNGARSPVSGMVHAGVLLLIMLFLGKWAGLIPLASLAAILVVVAYNMSEWHLFVRLFRAPKSDVAVLLTTFALTVLIDLMVAIEVGVVLAALLFMNRMANVASAGFLKELPLEDDEEDGPRRVGAEEIPRGVEIFQVTGPFFFGAADKFKTAIRRVEKTPKVLILRMRQVKAIDSTGLRILEDLCKKAKHEGTLLIMSGVHAQPMAAMDKIGLVDQIGEENLCANIDDALKRAREALGETEHAKDAPAVKPDAP
jgi:SulP family sulfate permease